MTQDEVFSASEANRWYERNRAALEAVDLAQDPILRLLDTYRIAPRRVLEIGGANGYRVAELARRTGCVGEVVEPSSLAITEGRARHPGLSFHRGEAKALPIEGPFDLVIVNYVLHWIDRVGLLRALAEVDRVLGDGGYLVIGDFDPAGPTRVRYHHLPDREVYTYKQDYAAIFVATALYQRVAALSGDSARLDAAVADDRRTVVTLLRKQLTAGYALRERPVEGN